MKEWYQENIAGPVREVIKNHGTKRSGRWNSVRKAYVKNNKFCAVCGTSKALNVHHIQPFHMRPDLELETSNLITLCRKHHFTFGHLGYWASWNRSVIQDCGHWKYKYRNRPRRN